MNKKNFYRLLILMNGIEAIYNSYIGEYDKAVYKLIWMILFIDIANKTIVTNYCKDEGSWYGNARTRIPPKPKLPPKKKKNI